jgi:hypothetical protein
MTELMEDIFISLDGFASAIDVGPYFWLRRDHATQGSLCAGSSQCDSPLPKQASG